LLTALHSPGFGQDDLLRDGLRICDVNDNKANIRCLCWPTCAETVQHNLSVSLEWKALVLEPEEGPISFELVNGLRSILRRRYPTFATQTRRACGSAALDADGSRLIGDDGGGLPGATPRGRWYPNIMDRASSDGIRQNPGGERGGAQGADRGLPVPVAEPTARKKSRCDRRVSFWKMCASRANDLLPSWEDFFRPHREGATVRGGLAMPRSRIRSGAGG
jgi:hypothetical protein